MIPNFAVINANVLTMDDAGLVSGGCVVVTDGVITHVGAQPPKEMPAECLDAAGALLTPGFVDSHTHLVFASHRADEFDRRNAGQTYQQIAAAGGGIQSSVRQCRSCSPTDLLRDSKQHAQWLLANGTTTAEVKSGYGLSFEHELQLLEVANVLESETGLSVSPTFLGAHAVPEGSDGHDYLRHVIHDILPEVRSRNLARAVDMYVEDKYFTPDAARELAQHAAGLALRLHVDQFSDAGGAALAVALGAQSADHLEYTGPAGIATLAASQTFAGLLPGSVFALGRTKYPDARAMLDAGVKVALATDFNPGTSPVASMPFVMNLARQFMGMTAAECWLASTIRGAESLGLADDRGSITKNKRADLVLWDATDPEEIGYWIGATPRKVWVAGNLRASR